MPARDAQRGDGVGATAPGLPDEQGRLDLSLSHLVRLACLGVDECDAAGITMTVRGRPTTVASSHPLAQSVDSAQYRVGDGPCLTSMRDGAVVRVADYGTETRWPAVVRAARAVGLGSSLSVPLRDGSRTLGALNLYSRAAHVFDGKAVAVADVLARQTAGAIRYLEVLQAEQARRDAEHQVAQTLQRGLLPTVTDLPGVDCATRYLVAADSAQVGGDWYDAFALPDGTVGVAIGDVIGHDMAAAAAMGQLRSVLRSYAYEGISPATVLDRLDRLVQDFDMAQLATALYGRLVLDADCAMLVFCNAGHPPPLLRLPDGTTRRLDGAASRLIGAPVPHRASRSEAAVLLPSGSTLLLYTDGLVERRGQDLDLSIDALCRTLAACPDDGDLEALCDRVLADTGPGDRSDDVALLALRIR